MERDGGLWRERHDGALELEEVGAQDTDEPAHARCDATPAAFLGLSSQTLNRLGAGTLGEPSVSVPVSTSDFSAKNHYMGEPPPRASQQFRALPAPLRSYRPPRGGPSGIGGHVRMGGGGMDAAAITALLSPRTDAG